jgi:hypothetical protein
MEISATEPIQIEAETLLETYVSKLRGGKLKREEAR